MPKYLIPLRSQGDFCFQDYGEGAKEAKTGRLRVFSVKNS
jgi:hypothetical protein